MAATIVNIECEVNQEDLAKVREAFSSAQKNVRGAIKNALNRAARASRKELISDVRGVYTLKGIKLGDLRLISATQGSLQAELKGAHRPRTLQSFKYRVLKAGVKSAAMKHGSMDFLGEKGWRAFMGTGGSIAGLIAQRKTRASDAKLKVLYGPSISKMVEMAWTGRGKGGFSPKEDPTQQKLHDEMMAEISKII